ncbi:TPA: hypothetical protein GDD11_13610 [Legionella pneumophila]|nr:hypothetical protein [Legionella pneumophila]HAT8332926.1 hypothetical protein [Legionella pneumophila]HCJ4394045.1 hypothetical protein [Legionella pneumophila]
MTALKLTRYIFLFSILIIWIICILEFIKLRENNFTSQGLEEFYVHNMISKYENEYLYTLRDTLLGCRTIKERKPDIIFFGDSHTYAGWDYNLLQKSFNKTVGACPVSGAYPESMIDLLIMLKNANLHPQSIVIGLSPRMLWQDENRNEKITWARDLFTEIIKPQENLLNLFKGNWKKIPQFINDGKVIKEKSERLKANLDGIKNDQIDKIIMNHFESIHSTNFFYNQIIKTHNKFIQPTNILHKLKKLANEQSIKLIFVYIPESKWLISHYTEAQLQEFHLFTAKIKTMGFILIDDVNLTTGFENIYFLNRFLVDNYPYHSWSDDKLLKAWIDEDFSTRQWQVFDPDHMNALGATKFTQYMLPLLKRYLS